MYEPGVLFLKVTMFRKLLPTFKGEKFLTIQVMGDGLLMGHVRMPLKPNEMLLYPNPEQTPQVHPSVVLSAALTSKSKPKYPSWLQWNEPPDAEVKKCENYPSWLRWNELDSKTKKADG